MKRKEGWLKLCVCALVLLCAFFDPLSGARMRVEDALYQRPGLTDPRIAVIGIDEKTLDALGPFQSWSRDKVAEMIEMLCRDAMFAPAVIGVDVGYYGLSGTDADGRLAAAAKLARDAGVKLVLTSLPTYGNVLTKTEDGTRRLSREVTLYEQPYEALREYAAVGHAYVLFDADGVVRRSLQSIEVDGARVSSFSWEVARALDDGVAQPPTDEFGQWYVPFTGRPYDYYGTQGAGSSFIDVLEGLYPYQVFAGGVVLIGPYAAGMGDAYFTSASRGEQMHGVEIHANIVQALLEGKHKVVLPAWAVVLATALALALSLVICRLLDVRFAALATLACSGLCVYGGLLAYNAGYVGSFLYAACGQWLLYLAHTFLNYFAERRERHRMVDLLSRYLSPQVAQEVAKAGVSLTGEKRDVAVLFVDIRGFTTISESMPPEEVVRFLNRYLELTTTSVFANAGTVDKFIGDATMALFNAPCDLPDYVYRAVKAARDMVDAAKKIAAELELGGGKRVGFGVGVHCGEAVVGNIGTQFRMDYTAIGDTVNTASRLEGQAAAGEVLVSAAVWERLAGRVEGEYLGERQLKGKAAGFKVYRVDRVLPESNGRNAS